MGIKLIEFELQGHYIPAN